VAVVGGGIGGLACALALHGAGVEVEVLERHGELTGRGTALGMWPQALRALDAIGLGEQVRATGVRQREMTFRRSDGSTLARMDVGRLERSSGDLPVLISRAALIRLLATALPAELVRLNTPVSPGDLDRLRTEYDVVIGADGIRSAVRSAFGGAPKLRYSGYTAWIGLVPGDGEASQEILGRGAKFGVTPAEDGMTNWYAPVWAPPDFPLSELRSRFEGWCDPVGPLLERSLAKDKTTEILRNAVHYLAPPPRGYVHGNLALLGDAAHAMTADLGQGACQALVDGVTLGRSLASGDPVEVALRRYDRLRRRPAQRVATAAKWLGRLTMYPPLTGVRNGVFRTAGLAGPRERSATRP
jgi:2-polyprenyl-6-methoxyphenol hydroxylase-like FAD-dependent oxidoreductase